MPWSAEAFDRARDANMLVTAVVSSGLIQSHLLPHLRLGELSCLECLNKPFRQLVADAPDHAWRDAVRRSVPVWTLPEQRVGHT